MHYPTDYEISDSLCVNLSNEISCMLYRLQSSTDVQQTFHQGKVPRDVITYYFLVKSKKNLSNKPKVELIFISAHIHQYLMSNISKMERDTMLDSKELDKKNNHELSISTKNFDPR